MRDLPLLNALLNSTATILLIVGYRHVRRGNVRRHKQCMLAALATSALFLVSYVIYHAGVGHTTFAHGGVAKAVYLTILATHVPLAALMVVPILMVARYALRGEIDRHRRLARWTLPVWLYVSFTGVVIYVMLYHLFPSR